MTIADLLRRQLIKEDICPEYLGELDTGWECNDCGYDVVYAEPAAELGLADCDEEESKERG